MTLLTIIRPFTVLYLYPIKINALRGLVSGYAEYGNTLLDTFGKVAQARKLAISVAGPEV
jgi:hypothetical protein